MSEENSHLSLRGKERSTSFASSSSKQKSFKRPISITVSFAPPRSPSAPFSQAQDSVRRPDITVTPPESSSSSTSASSTSSSTTLSPQNNPQGLLMPHLAVPAPSISPNLGFKFSASPDYFRHGSRRSLLTSSSKTLRTVDIDSDKDGKEKAIAIEKKRNVSKIHQSSWSALNSSSTGRVRKPRVPMTGLETEYDIVTDQLGFGATATVMLGKRKSGGERVAIKRIPKRFILDKDEFKKISHEVEILKKLHHPNLIGYIDALIENEFLNIIIEFAPGEELFDYIKEKRRLSEYEAAVIIRGVARGLQYIHENSIVHADLKPENIIIGRDDDHPDSDCPTSIKIIDFGLSQIISSASEDDDDDDDGEGMRKSILDEDKVDSGCEAGGTLPYRAPELLEGSPSTAASDMWALGVILFIMLAGYPPFMSESHSSDELLNSSMPFFALFHDYNDYLRDCILTADFEGVMYPEIWEGISCQAENLVRSLLSRNPSDRPTAAQLLEDEWIVNLDSLPRKVIHPASSSLRSSNSQCVLFSSLSSSSLCSSTPQCFHLDESAPESPTEEEQDDGLMLVGRSVRHELQFLDHALRDSRKLGVIRDSLSCTSTPGLELTLDEDEDEDDE